MMYHLHESSGESAGTIYATTEQLSRLAELHDQVQREIDFSISCMTTALGIARQIGADAWAEMITAHIANSMQMRELVDTAVLAAWPAAGSA